MNILNHSFVQRPKIILGNADGLDGGYIGKTVVGNGYDQEESPELQKLQTTTQRVLQSKKTADQLVSGRIYLTYHAETDNKVLHFPLGTGPLGIKRANYMSTLFSKYGKFGPPKTIITAQTKEMNPPRGQHMEGTVMSLANSLGLDIVPGPLLLDNPEWTYVPAQESADMALSALENATVLMSWWSYTK